MIFFFLIPGALKFFRMCFFSSISLFLILRDVKLEYLFDVYHVYYSCTDSLSSVPIRQPLLRILEFVVLRNPFILRIYIYVYP